MHAHHEHPGAACSKRPHDLHSDPGPGFVYLVETVGLHKFYAASEEEGVLSHLQDLRRRLPFPVKLIHVIKAEDPGYLIDSFAKLYQWQDLGGGWLDLRNLDVEFIKTFRGVTS